MRRGEYGYDAPYALAIFGFLAMAAGLAAAIQWWSRAIPAAAQMTLVCGLFLANFLSFLYTTRRGKFQEWERILDLIELRGDETALDMGCGRGAVLTALARRLPRGRAIGVDIWSRKDQWGNGKDAALRNAALEGVGERVEIETADMRALPFSDARFDVVVSSLAIHNIPSDADRQRAIAEAFRVVKPGGRMAIADIRATAAYAKTLRKLGAVKIERRRLGWRFWWGNPAAATRLLTASKPG
ncbi:MAG TPA: class I SAM-dependent methyltransferase [Bryobacteraceae bacterium]|nr:class I SAM-dependent methyltransferase [Bryobacteraceae bacterium]